MNFQTQRLVKKMRTLSLLKWRQRTGKHKLQNSNLLHHKDCTELFRKGSKVAFHSFYFSDLPTTEQLQLLRNTWPSIITKDMTELSVLGKQHSQTKLQTEETQNFNQNILLCSSTYICIFQNPHCQNPFNQDYVTPVLRVVKSYILLLKLLRRSRKSETKTRILSKPANKPKYFCMTH